MDFQLSEQQIRRVLREYADSGAPLRIVRNGGVVLLTLEDAECFDELAVESIKQPRER